jgi:hypothetical protein
MKVSLYYHTLKYLKPIQVYSRIWNSLYKPGIHCDDFPGCRQILGHWEWPLNKKQSFFPPNQFLFLNIKQKLVSSSDWQSLSNDRLWLYNLHYFDDLTGESAESRLEAHRKLNRVQNRAGRLIHCLYAS